jgi:hypothetical protein
MTPELLELAWTLWSNALRVHPYRDRPGGPRYLHIRLDTDDHKSKFRWATVLDDGSLAPGRNDNGVEVEPVYRYAEAKHALAVDPERELWIAEGERDVDTLWDRGYVAICQPDGASKPGHAVKWKPAYTEAVRALNPKAINVVADNDAPGLWTAGNIADALGATRWVPTQGNDVTDSEGQMRQVDQFEGYGSDQGRKRSSGLAVSSSLPLIQPSDLVTADRVLDLWSEIRGVLTKYVKFQREEDYDAVALWVLHTWAIEAADSTLYLWIYAPQKQCGKTRLLEVLSLLARNGELLVSPTSATIHRLLSEEGAYTVLVTELDKVFTGPASEVGKTLQGMLNAGYRRGAVVRRQDEKQQSRRFFLFSAKAFDGIERAHDVLPDQTRDRSLPIRMWRAKRGTVARFHWRTAVEETAGLRGKLDSWATQAVPGLRTARPELPEDLDDRRAECWEPMFAIADLGSVDFGAQMRKTAVSMHQRVEEEALDIQLLRAIRDLFEEQRTKDPDGPDVDKIHSEALVHRLVSLPGEDNPWRERWQMVDSPLARKKSIAKMLAPYDIRPTDTWIGGVNRQGYRRAQFEQAWSSFVVELD